MRSLFLAIIIIFNYLAVYSQPGFNQIYNPNTRSTAFLNVLVDTDTTFIVYGVTYNDEPPFQQGIWFARLDTFGNTLQVSNWFDPDGEHMALNLSSDFIRTSSGGFAADGNYINEQKSGFFLILDTDLQITLFKKFDNPGSLIRCPAINCLM